MSRKQESPSFQSRSKSVSAELAAVVEAGDKLKAAASQAESLKEQLNGLAKERDSATAEITNLQGLIEKLRAQLAEQTKKVTELEAQNKKLQQALSSLLGARN